ncbi:transmembrane protein, putative, partial [Bodo saltans]
SHSISQEASPSFSESSTSWPTQSPTKQMTTEGTLSRSTTTSTCVSDSVTFRVSKTLLASPTKYSPTETISTRSMSVVTQHPTWSRQSITQSPSIRPTSTVSPTHTSSVANPNVLVVATAAPITAATQGVSAGVAATAAIFAASSAGGALMQASLGSAPCANNNGGDSTSSTDRSSNPAMYLISPFYGINDYAMVLGNIALVVTAFLLHVIGGVAVKFIERFFPICMFRGFAPVDEFTTDTGAMVTNVWTVPIPAGDYPSSVLHFLGPNSFWRPRDARLMFGATFTSYKPTSLARSNTDVASLVWLAGDVLMLPTIICIASTTKPPSTARWATCNGVMLAAGLLLLDGVCHSTCVCQAVSNRCEECYQSVGRSMDGHNVSVSLPADDRSHDDNKRRYRTRSSVVAAKHYGAALGCVRGDCVLLDGSQHGTTRTAAGES